MNAALQMLVGGIGLLVAGSLRSEWGSLSFSWAGFSAVAYLATFGSIIAFTAYVYVLRKWPATIVGTYVYVNTVVAVLLGWLILDEPITARTVLSMAIVMAAVLMVRRSSAR
jgi:drug/metabolite transporter (DMT)-like permease